MNIRSITAIGAVCAVAAGGSGAAFAATSSDTKSDSAAKTESGATARPDGNCGGKRGKGVRGGPLQEVATALGIKVADLRKQLAAGTKLSAIASAKGKSLDDVKSAVKAALKTKLDKQVSAGTITQAQADERLSHVDDLIDSIESGKRPTPPAGAPKGGPDGGPGGYGGPAGYGTTEAAPATSGTQS